MEREYREPKGRAADVAFLAAYPSMSAPCRPLPLPLLPLLSAADVPALSKPQRTRLQKKKQKKRKRMNGEELKAFYAHWCELWGQQKLLNFLAIQLMAGFVTLSLPLPSPSLLAFTCALHQAVQNCARPRAFAFKCAAPLSACFLSNPAPVPRSPSPTPSPSLRTRCAR